VSQAKVWKETRKCTELLQKQFLKLKNLKQSDIKVLDFWASVID
jgi:hypothetical protein